MTKNHDDEERARAYIRTFNALAMKLYGPESSQAQAIFKNHGLCYDYKYNEVRMVWNYRDEKQVVDLVLDCGPVFFAPDWSDAYLFACTWEAFLEDPSTTQLSILEQLHAAELVSEDFYREHRESVTRGLLPETASPPITPRPAVQSFAQEMERILRNNDYKGGWRSETLSYLLTRLKQEVQELEKALIDGSPPDIVCECADVANFAMMIADNVKRRNEPHD